VPLLLSVLLHLHTQQQQQEMLQLVQQVPLVL
jgi:hypothetical protein